MSGTNHKDQDEQEEADGQRLSFCLRTLMDQMGVSSYDIEKLTGLPPSTVRRLSNGGQEPKLSVLARIERAIGVEVGTVARMSDLVNTVNIKDLLASDPALLPIFRTVAVEHYNTWLKLSSDSISRL